MQVLPDRVTATCTHAPVASAAGPLTCCSPPAPEVVMANRAVPLPLSGVRNMFAVVPVPKSKIRLQLVSAVRRTQQATVKSPTPPRIPLGSRAYPLLPARLSAFPVRPATHDVPPATVAG